MLEPRLSLALQRTLARAAAQVEGSGRSAVEEPDLLVALYSESESFAVALLEQQGVTRLDVVSYLAHGVSKAGKAPRGGRAAVGRPQPLAPGEDDEALAAYTQDLTELARQGAIDPLVGRRREIDRTLHVLQRRRKNNPALRRRPGDVRRDAPGVAAAGPAGREEAATPEGGRCCAGCSGAYSAGPRSSSPPG